MNLRVVSSAYYASHHQGAICTDLAEPGRKLTEFEYLLLLIHASEITVFFFKHTILSGCEKSKIGRNRKDSFEYICLGKFTCHTHNLIS